jgi:predicted nuclease with TOPRIM domain
MKETRIHRLSASVLMLACVAIGGTSAVYGATLNDIFSVAARLNTQAKQSQARVDALTEETRKLLSEYKTVLKEIEGLQVYNRQLEKQVANQQKEMSDLSGAIDKVTVIERQITPLMLRMIDGLEQFVGLDLPFLMKERNDRVERLREMMERADVAASEKFSQILRAYQIENEYGRTMEAYTDQIEVNGAPRVVDILKVGRIALVYQTSDGEETGTWDPTKKAWVTLDDSYTTPIRNGIRMARKQLSVDMLTVPITAPGAAQ